jgi:hypothetical protein
MSSDFYDAAARKRYQILEAAKAQSMADLQRYQADENEHGAIEELQTLATLNDQQASLERLHRTYMAQRNPPAPLPESDGEFMAKAPERMSYADVMKITGKSKYALDPQTEARNIQQGIAELARRKASGDIQT